MARKRKTTENVNEDSKTLNNVAMKRKMIKTTSGLTHREIARRQRITVALRMRDEGYNWVEISTALGFENAESAWKFVDRNLRLFDQDTMQDVAKTWVRRFDKMYQGIHKEAISGKASAIDLSMRIADKSMALLGVVNPQSAGGGSGGNTQTVNILSVNMTDAELTARLEETRAQAEALRQRRLMLQDDKGRDEKPEFTDEEREFMARDVQGLDTELDLDTVEEISAFRKGPPKRIEGKGPKGKPRNGNGNGNGNNGNGKHR